MTNTPASEAAASSRDLTCDADMRRIIDESGWNSRVKAMAGEILRMRAELESSPLRKARDEAELLRLQVECSKLRAQLAASGGVVDEAETIYKDALERLEKLEPKPASPAQEIQEALRKRYEKSGFDYKPTASVFPPSHRAPEMGKIATGGVDCGGGVSVGSGYGGVAHGRVPEPSIATTSPYCQQSQPFVASECGFQFDPADPVGCKVGPATGQPRTEAPVGPDGSGTILQVVPQGEIRFQLADEGTVVELGEAFRKAMDFASPSPAYLRDQRPGESFSDTRLRNLQTAVAELAKVVERIAAKMG